MNNLTGRSIMHWLPNVSFTDRYALKEIGCRWDSQVRCWYAPSKSIYLLATEIIKKPHTKLEKSSKVKADNCRWNGPIKFGMTGPKHIPESDGSLPWDD